MAKVNQRTRTTSKARTNNPEGRNQYSGGFTQLARERPFAAAVTAAATVGAGVFLWSRRGQISDQIGSLSDQFAEWREGMQADAMAFDGANERPFIAAPTTKSTKSGKKAQRDFAQEALSLKQTGKSGDRPADPVVEEQTKVGAIAY